MTDLDTLRYDLAVANRILAREGVVDAFGHISVRHPDRPDRYILSCSRSPEIVARADLVEHLIDGEPVEESEDRTLYAERPIHGAIYEARPDIQSVVHNHSHAVVPFGVTRTPLRPMIHVAGGIGAEIPVWDIRDRFDDTNLLVTTMEQGRDLARALGQGAVALMRGHGCVVAGPSLSQAVMTAIYLQVNASLLLDSLRLGPVTFLSAGEVAACAQISAIPMVAERTWEYWKVRADREGI